MKFFRKKKNNQEKITRIFFATDVHGSEPTFRKFINSYKIYGADVLLLGGDITGKMIIPVIHQKDNTYFSNFFGETIKAKNENELNDLKRKILTVGAYIAIINIEEYQNFKEDEKSLDKLFNQLMRERIIRWITLAEERLKGSQVICYITGGNDDSQNIIDLIKNTEHVKNPDNKVVKINDIHELVSLGWSNETPWKTPRECAEEDLRDKIENLISKVNDTNNAIFNFHVPPKDSRLDLAPKLDSSVYPPKPIIKGGRIEMFGAGSIAVRESIEKYQPLIGLHGHIHESKGAIKIGKTLCINPGSEYGEAVLRGAMINIGDGKITQYQFMYG